ncbi:uncharacterized protein Dyak_GE28946 [Drosophila yakuba]|uniref:Uncharacterized protein n=1 Tax=Drosophila yakuba TaxID=7245 RepID=A0A0R1DWV3_DROYA|nr:uncharacterized protein Dyak_GE28946 [Drosophila yakuba]
MAGYNVRICQRVRDECRNTAKFPRSGQNVIDFNMNCRVEGTLMGKLELMGRYRNKGRDENKQKCSFAQADRHFAATAIEGNSHQSALPRNVNGHPTYRAVQSIHLAHEAVVPKPIIVVIILGNPVFPPTRVGTFRFMSLMRSLRFPLDGIGGKVGGSG